jgi:signal transduction histidine kinase
MHERKKQDTMTATGPQPVPAPYHRPATILLVEDNRTLNNILFEFLRGQGYQMLTAQDGWEALELLHKQPVHLVISDIVMPGLDGYGLLQAIRSDPVLGHLPVIFLTGYATAADRRRAKESGVEDYLTKPLDNTDLLAAVQNVLARRMMLAEDFQRQVDAVRNQILGLMQHEFRTPLTFVMGYAEFLHNALNEQIERAELQRSVEAILEGSRRLHQLVESFLTLASLSEQTLDPADLYPIDPTALWRESLGGVRAELEHSHLQVVIEEPPDPVIVFGVLDLLREALVRLLDNAIRYRRKESRTIWLATITRPGYIGWQIRDQGIGMPANTLAHVAQPFSRLPRGPSAHHGIGLGLALVQRVAELHGGFLTAESQEGVGSEITLWVSDAEPTYH